MTAPTDPDFKAIEPRIVEYSYDVRAAAELLQGLGYVRGADGTFRDGSGQPLTIEVRGADRTTLAVADYWNEGVERWTYLRPAGHYVRLSSDPDRGPQAHPHVIGVEFLELVRRGLRSQPDPLIDFG